jgi:N-acetylmuramoyl-L-alanine amidase
MTKRKSLSKFVLVVFALTANIVFADSVKITDLCARYALSGPFQKGSNVMARDANFSLVFETNSRKLVFDDLLIWMNAPLTESNGCFCLSAPDVSCIDALLRSAQTLACAGCSTVVIDPGHGGKDTGAIGPNNVYEKKVTLDIAGRVTKKLKNSGLTIRLTRKRDSTLTLQERTSRAKAWDADLFVSIHVNSANNTNASGIEIYTLPAPGFPSTAGEKSHPWFFDQIKTNASGLPAVAVGSPKSDSCPGNAYDCAAMVLACDIQTQLLAHVSGSESRGIKHARYDVLAEAPCPAVLVECGFVSNQADAERLRYEEYLDGVADGIAQGILSYVNAVKSAHVRQ